MNKTKILILTTVFIDVVGMGIIIPILPFYVERFTSSAFLITSLFAVYAMCSFFSAPVIGAISDRVGRKAMLIASIFSTSIGWFVFAAAPNLFFLYLGRIIDGLAAGNLPIAQAYLVDISKNDKERSQNLGLIGAVFGIAFILGPLFGGLLGSISHSFPFWFVGTLALVNGILGIFILPETHNDRGENKKISINPFVPLGRAIKNKSLLPNYLAWFLFGLAISSFQSVFTLYAQKTFGFGTAAVGWIFAGMGVVIAINQMFALKHFWLKYFREPVLELSMIVIYGIGFLFMAVGNLPFLVIALVLQTFGQSVLRVVMNSQILSKTDPKMKGETLGVTTSINSLSMAIGPFVAGFLFGFSKYLPFVLSSILLFGAAAVLYKNRKALRISKLSEEPTISEI